MFSEYKTDLASAAEVNDVVGGTTLEVGAAGGVEVAVGVAEVAGAVGVACVAAASGPVCPAVEAVPACLDLGEVWDEPLSESSELQYW